MVFQVAIVVKNSPVNTGDVRDTVQSLGREDTLEEGMANHSSILPRYSHGQRSLVGSGPWVPNSWTGLKQLNTHAPLYTH